MYSVLCLTGADNFMFVISSPNYRRLGMSSSPRMPILATNQEAVAISGENKVEPVGAQLRHPFSSCTYFFRLTFV